MAQAKTIGYNLPKRYAKTSESSWDDKASKVQRGLLDGTLRTYKGVAVPQGGCVGVAADDLTKNSRVPKRIEGGGVELKQLQKTSPTSLGDAQVGVIRLDAIFATKKDARYVEMIRSWSSCMSKKGFDYKTPEKAMDDNRWNGDTPSGSEKRTAVADMTCKKEVNYLGVASRVQSAYEEKVISARKWELAELRRNLKAWKTNADAALKGSSG
ncbi:hypothetical protein OG819_09135 [Streptomyces sp. NBC_01549]|uniref:hypothetical protein n=1 Tax=Streptomyces sp. NBC_01549 TaxID=2975874 RepID=UPI0022502361|nr:hypothetical protein [Streptomyces sp. NBC_01549]MCX4589921.1 hypothetical protein [Streptomyces sp. NBC_01549]